MESNLDEYFVEQKSKVDRFLDFLVFIAVFLVTIFLILEIVVIAGKTNIDIIKLNQIYFYVNLVVFLIFVADLFRLYKQSINLKNFFSKNWLDILATIPFGLLGSILSNYKILNVLKLARFSKLASASKVVKAQKISRIGKIGKEFKAAAHLKKESEEYQRKHRL